MAPPAAMDLLAAAQRPAYAHLMLSRARRISRWAHERLVAPVALLATSLATIMLVSVSAAADTAAPQPNLLKAPPVWLGLLVMFILLAMVVSVSLMPSRRSHQD
jgi:hypothetical protein